ncbi:amidase domain-containing protein [Bacillus sp. FJAT-27445]|uniref:amidase domain-containing protein n=1 Tax=Bacillus sp. FJAT-27445 TaxID=1679166 RepID=UPI0012E330C9|nr:amidase domain-containing protein [Bacillus sp. FJAT-27445]
MLNILKKSFTIILASLFLLTLSLPSTPTKAINQDNPYITAYLNEKNQNLTLKVDKDPLVDPVVEDQIIRDALESYYQEDLKVAEYLVEYFGDDGLKEQTISLEKEVRIKIMHKIQEIYTSLEDQDKKSLLFDYLDRYVKGTDDARTKIFLDKVKEKQNNNMNLASSYNTYSAADWAYNNYNKYSTNYPNFTGSYGSDCANFVSQAMHVGGGMPKSGNWTITKKNSTYWIINSAYELDYSWTLTDPSPWISVVEFKSYWNPKSTVHSMATSYYKTNHTQVYNRPIYRGGVVILHKGASGFITVPTHVMIISDYDNNNSDFKLAGHSNERQALPLLTAISDYAHLEILVIN